MRATTTTGRKRDRTLFVSSGKQTVHTNTMDRVMVSALDRLAKLKSSRRSDRPSDAPRPITPTLESSTLVLALASMPPQCKPPVLDDPARAHDARHDEPR
jgi:hypothetical protein